MSFVSSDVVGVADADGDQHKFNTSTFAVVPGIEVAYDLGSSTSSITSLRARLSGAYAPSASGIVHVHDDTVFNPSNTIVITSQHSVEHLISRLDAQLLLSHEFSEVPLRILAGVSYGMAMKDKVLETITEVGRDTLPKKEIKREAWPQGTINSVTFEHPVTHRLGLVLGLGIPVRWDRFEIVPSIESNIGLSYTVPVDAGEHAIPYTSHIVVVSCAFLYRL